LFAAFFATIPKDAKNESHGDAQHFSEHPICLRELADRPAISESCQDLRFPNCWLPPHGPGRALFSASGSYLG
jgi:hypothetical protein